MIGLFSRWVELMITQDTEKFANVAMLLKNADIEYKEKIQNIGHTNRGRGQMGTLGENAKYTNLYQIYVKKKDAAQAKAVITSN